MNAICDTHSVVKALQNVKHAEEALERARKFEQEAAIELNRAVEELTRAEEEERCEREKVTVHVTHVNEVETVEFRERLSVTLQYVWDQAYEKLKIPKGPKDVFQTAGHPPVSLMTHLHLTLEQAKEHHVITDFCFEIVAETGGA